MGKGRRDVRRSGSRGTCRSHKGIGRGPGDSHYPWRAAAIAPTPETSDSRKVNHSPKPEGLIVRGTWRRSARIEAEVILNKVRSVNRRILKVEGIQDDFPAPKNVNSAKPLEVLRRTSERTAVVDKSRCAGCGFCIAICPECALSINEYVAVDSNRCNGCGLCVEECPNEALSLSEPRQAPAAAEIET